MPTLELPSPLLPQCGLSCLDRRSELSEHLRYHSASWPPGPDVRGQRGTPGAAASCRFPHRPGTAPLSGLPQCLASICDHRMMGRGWLGREGWVCEHFRVGRSVPLRSGFNPEGSWGQQSWGPQELSCSPLPGLGSESHLSGVACDFSTGFCTLSTAYLGVLLPTLPLSSTSLDDWAK